MAARANWKGYLRLSLVSCPVALFPATTESEKRFASISSTSRPAIASVIGRLMMRPVARSTARTSSKPMRSPKETT